MEVGDGKKPEEDEDVEIEKEILKRKRRILNKVEKKNKYKN